MAIQYQPNDQSWKKENRQTMNHDGVIKKVSGWYYNPHTDRNHYVLAGDTKTACDKNVDPILPPKAKPEYFCVSCRKWQTQANIQMNKILADQ